VVSDYREFHSDATVDTVNTEGTGTEKQRHPSIQGLDSPTQGAGASRAEAFRVVQRHARTSSPRSIHDKAELIEFDQACRWELGLSTVDYVAEPACDGLAVELIYQDGRLMEASTIADGLNGEDITAAMRTIGEVPLLLRSQTSWLVPERLVVHGKVYITKSDFRALNEELGRQSAGQKFFASPRDAVIGSLRQLYPQVTASSRLRIFINDLIGAPNDDFSTHWEVLEVLLGWGFRINVEQIQHCASVVDAIDYFNTVASIRETLPYETDGVVYRVDRLSDRAALELQDGISPCTVLHKFPARDDTAGVKNSEQIKRFQKSEIIYHWVQGLPFLFLLMSGGLILLSKFYQLEPGIINSLRIFHKFSAAVWAVGLAIAFFFIGFKVHLVNLRQMLTWTKDDLNWMILSALVIFNSKIKVPDAGKFNPGQKLNMLLVISYFFGFLTTGLLMWFRGTILISWYLHVALFFAALGSLGGHLYLSFIHPSTRIGLGGIFHGWVSKKYIEHHHALTLKLDQGAISTDKRVHVPQITKEW
jgi:formate dehydrogenase gamma subunit